MDTLTDTCEVEGCSQLATHFVRDMTEWWSEAYGYKYYVPLGVIHGYCATHARESETFIAGYDGSKAVLNAR